MRFTNFKLMFYLISFVKCIQHDNQDVIMDDAK